MRDLNHYREPMLKCSWCEYCQATCPIYLEDLLETHVARSRLNLIRMCLLEKALPVSDRFEEIVDRCLCCSNCSQTCPAKIPVEEMVMAARSILYQGKRRNLPQRILMRRFMEHRGVGKLMSAMQSLAVGLGLFFEEVPAMAVFPFLDRVRGRIPAVGEPRGRVAYYVGCATNSFYPGTAEDTVSVLTRNGLEVVIPEGLVCCGLPALAEGDFDTAEAMARKNYEVLTALEVDAIVTDCTSCGLTLKSKAMKVLPDQDPLRLKAELMAPKVWEVTDYLNRIGLSSLPSALPQKFTYLVPCHRGWTPTLKEAPINLLAKVPGAELIQLEYPERCCGGGGAFSLEHRDLSRRIRAKKLEDILQTGAKTVVTQCPSCRSFVAPALPEHSILHPVSFLARAYGLRTR
jgi:glycolate oxidase iron-sulfur subunit